MKTGCKTKIDENNLYGRCALDSGFVLGVTGLSAWSLSLTESTERRVVQVDQRYQGLPTGSHDSTTKWAFARTPASANVSNGHLRHDPDLVR